jgi:UDP-N-acetylmuramate--alanine ligase
VVGYEKNDRQVTLSFKGEPFSAWSLRVPGAHNAVNSATALVLGWYAGADINVMSQSLSKFGGVDRRSQLLGERAHPGGGTIRVYDDYGHHPTEVEVTLRALRELERPEERGGRLICVFQPHQHSRTRFLLEEFANSFSSADVVIVPHIYFVRDSQEEKHKVTASDLVDRLRDKGVRAMHLYPFEAIVEQLENVCRGGDMLVVMGAGPVNEVAYGYLAGSRHSRGAQVAESRRG